jgi:hypothetical protein
LFLGDARSDDKSRRRSHQLPLRVRPRRPRGGFLHKRARSRRKILAEVKGSGDLIGKGAGVTEQEVRTITNVTASAGVCRVGQTISGAGISAKTQIVAVDTAAKTSLSSQAAASGAGRSSHAISPESVSVTVEGLPDGRAYEQQLPADSR